VMTTTLPSKSLMPISFALKYCHYSVRLMCPVYLQ
jgi:hypothetical protein